MASTDFGPFKKGHVVLLDDLRPEDAGWIQTGYLHELKESDGGDGQGAHRAG